MDDDTVLRALRRTLLSLFEEPTKRYTYEDASAKSGIVQSRLHTLAQGSIPVRIDNLPELLIALERLDSELLNRELWFERFVEEERLRLSADHPRNPVAGREHPEDEKKPMAALIGHLDGQRFSGQAAAIGANRYRIAIFPNAFRSDTLIQQPVHLEIQNLTILQGAAGLSAGGDWARLARDLLALQGRNLTAEQLAYIQQCTYELPLLRELRRTLPPSERLLIASGPRKLGLTLFKGAANWKLLGTVLEPADMKEMTDNNLPATFEYCEAICKNPNNGIDGIVILQYNTAKKELHITYFTPVGLCGETRRPDSEIDFEGLVARATPLMEDLITAEAAGEPEFLTLHKMRVALMQLDHADLRHGLIEVVAYINYKGDRRDATEENAVRYNTKLSEAYRIDKGLDHSLNLRRKVKM